MTLVQPNASLCCWRTLLPDLIRWIASSSTPNSSVDWFPSRQSWRPDYSVTVHNALVGFVELKAPGKGADPRKFKDPHDKAQWEKLRSLPNLLYTDANAFSLWQNGELVDKVLTLNGDIETSGTKLTPPSGLHLLFESFLGWQPIAPKSAKELAHTVGRLCHFLSR
jgi:hypothetical protein